MTDQERAVRSNVWEVRRACLDHAMSVQTIAGDANAVVAYATTLEAYVLREVTVKSVTEPSE